MARRRAGGRLNHDRVATVNEQSSARPETAAVKTRDAEIAGGITTLITAQLIEEHRVRSAGRHSPALDFVLGYFRRAPTAGKMALLATEPATWKIVVLSGEQGQPHEVLDDQTFASEDDAAHAVFLRRLQLIGALPPETQMPKVRRKDE